MDIKDSILKHLKTRKVMQLATVQDGQPWVCTVHFWADNGGKLYWISTETRRHSQEIKDNPKVAAAIVVQTDEAVAGTPPICIHCEGDAEIVTDPEEWKTVLRKYFDYHTKPEQLYEDIIAGKKPDKLYRLKPRLFVLFDVQNSPKDPRQEWRVTE